MKKINLLCFLIFTSIIIFSCSKENRIQTKIDEYVKKNFNDPESYELIELKLIDTLTTKKAAQYIIDIRSGMIDNINEYVKSKNKEISDRALSAFLGGPSFALNEEVEQLKQEKAELTKYNDTISMYQKENERIKKFLSKKGIVYFRYKHNYRTKNNTGVLIKYTDTLRIDKEDNIIEDYNSYILKSLEDK
ncbi:MAG: hypothetical protein ABIQ27_01000 [Flavobacterium sp.]|uniref:hypothetical protein n=1 Tax=Flavobacterium sp. TaxID=239 RepID=UPI0032657F72